MNHPKRSDYRNRYKNLSLEELKTVSTRIGGDIHDANLSDNKKRARMYMIHHDYVLNLIDKKEKLLKESNKYKLKISPNSSGLSMQIEGTITTFATANKEEYAQYIVNSVNMHENLLKALKLLKGVYDSQTVLSYENEKFINSLIV